MTASVPNGLASHALNAVTQAEELDMATVDDLNAKLAAVEVKVEHLANALGKVGDLPQSVATLATAVEALQKAQEAQTERDEQERKERARRREEFNKRAWDAFWKLGTFTGALGWAAQGSGIL